MTHHLYSFLICLRCAYYGHSIAAVSHRVIFMPFPYESGMASMYLMGLHCSRLYLFLVPWDFYYQVSLPSYDAIGNASLYIH